VGRRIDDIEHLAQNCRFRNCKHNGEPGCAICAALDGGLLDADRWAYFQKLSREMAALELAKDQTAQDVERRRLAVLQNAYRSNKKDLRDL